MELREKIAHIVDEMHGFFNPSLMRPPLVKCDNLECIAADPPDCEYCWADTIIRMCEDHYKKAGMVMLDEDQTPPSYWRPAHSASPHEIYRLAGFRRIKE